MIEYAYRDSLRPRKNRLTSCTIVSKKVLSIKATKKFYALFVLTILDLQSGKKTCEARTVKNFVQVAGILYP